ncbi:MAG: squalene/phytoene synthase family protein, partial [Saprospiraceae bacterium]|nr:squalene/phytoene synthase family protein [Saprospiraceae bacterium]
NSKLRSFIWNMFAIVEFDAYRKNQLITGEQLEWYSNCLARSVTDGLQYFIGNHHTYPSTSHQYLAAKAAHLTHQLRDMVDDLSNGFINIPKEYLAVNSIDRIQMDHPALRSWVKDRVEFARMYFREGKQYLDNLKVVRCKLVGRWYCARFEKILDKIVHDDYLLRKVYNKGRGGSSQLKMSWLAFTRPFRHQNRF